MKDLKQRMIEDMKLRGLALGTQARYLEAIKALAKTPAPEEYTLYQSFITSDRLSIFANKRKIYPWL